MPTEAVQPNGGDWVDAATLTPEWWEACLLARNKACRGRESRGGLLCSLHSAAYTCILPLSKLLKSALPGAISNALRPPTAAFLVGLIWLPFSYPHSRPAHVKSMWFTAVQCSHCSGSLPLPPTHQSPPPKSLARRCLPYLTLHYLTLRDSTTTTLFSFLPPVLLFEPCHSLSPSPFPPPTLPPIYSDNKTAGGRPLTSFLAPT